MHILITPLGLTYGVLYSGIVLTRPDHVIVLTSKQAAQNVEVAVNAARHIHPDFTVEVHIVTDPFAGFAEGRQLAARLAQRLRSNRGHQYTVSLTGGTTVLQDAAKCLADLLDAREIALVDRRSVEEQKANPFVLGELVEIPPRPESD
jgi:hypothetical protein